MRAQASIDTVREAGPGLPELVPGAQQTDGMVALKKGKLRRRGAEVSQGIGMRPPGERVRGRGQRGEVQGSTVSVSMNFAIVPPLASSFERNSLNDIAGRITVLDRRLHPICFFVRLTPR